MSSSHVDLMAEKCFLYQVCMETALRNYNYLSVKTEI